MNTSAIAALEKRFHLDEAREKLRENPDDTDAQIHLFSGLIATFALAGGGYDSGELAPLLLRLVDKVPEVWGTDSSDFIFPGDDWYDVVGTRWKAAVAREPQNIDVLLNAARFFAPGDRATARALYEQAYQIDPDFPGIRAQFGSFELEGAEWLSEGATFERAAMLLDSRGDSDGWPVRPGLAAWARFRNGDLERARALAEHARVGVHPFWLEERNHGESILGMIALRNNNDELVALDHLGRSQVERLGAMPSFVLAQALLDRNYATSVREYLKWAGEKRPRISRYVANIAKCLDTGALVKLTLPTVANPDTSQGPSIAPG